LLLIGIAIALVGALLCGRQAWSRNSIKPAHSSSPILERIAVFLNSGLAILFLLGILVAVARSRRTSPMYFAVSVASLLIIASPFFLWRSPWRGFAEGAATMGLGVLIILGGFSFGPYVVPFALLMILGAVQAERGRTPTAASNSPPK
jgi:hypothetical protein